MPGGRPAAPVEIIPQNEVLDAGQIILESHNITSLAISMPDTLCVIKWCARHKLLKNSCVCPRCANPCRFISRGDISDGKTWYCAVCKVRVSIRQGSWFQNSHLSLYNILIIGYSWSYDYPQRSIAREANCDVTKTVVDWANFHRELCEQWLEDNPSQIGGFDPITGDPLVVEVDESKYFHRKYHRGQWREGHWVFGGIERGSKKCFLVIVPDRTEETLREMTLQWILPGTHIMSDGWRAYGNIDTWQHGIYTHSTVIHQQNFVDPLDDEVHTQLVENMWMRAKRKLRRQCGTSNELFPSYLHEFIWRQTIPDFNKKAFQHVMNLICNRYPL